MSKLVAFAAIQGAYNIVSKAEGKYKRALETYKQLTLERFDDNSTIALSALVTLDGEDAATRTVFIGPLEGGMKVVDESAEIVVITPASPLGRDLIGRSVGDRVRIGSGHGGKYFEIVAVR